jgi:hypothetical protein
MSPLNQTLLTLVELLLIVTLPLIALAALQNLRLNSARLKSETRDGERKTIAEIVKTAVAAAEQTGVLENLVGPEKKAHALEVAEGYLREQGIDIDLKQLSDYIEAEVLTQARSGGAASPATPADQQVLVNNAVETAVLAAEQSGLKGLIQNIAIELATQFLEANGVKVDAELLDGLIEGQLMRLFLAARGQLPSSGM